MTRVDAVQETFARLKAGGIPPEEALTEARLLVFHTLQISPEELRMRPEISVTETKQELLDRLTQRRARREPFAYLVGERYFFGLPFEVTPDVLIPRPETELVVETALQHLAAASSGHRFADVGTGSGCIAVAVAVNAPEADVYATDISTDALAVAVRNAERSGVRTVGRFLAGDLLAPVTDYQPFDVIVSNPPYIAPAEIDTLQPEVRDWEPRVALGQNADALHFYQRLAQEAPPLLASGGLLAVEVGQGQAEAVLKLWQDAGLRNTAALPDFAGISRVVRGEKV